MILYDEDIQKYNVVVDTSTKNISFLRMSVLLKRMGIKNNKFFLALIHPQLLGVDAFTCTDPKLKELIIIECKLNPWYFLREIARVPAQGADGIPYELNRGNLALSWLFFNAIDIFLTMPRQVGKTIGTQALFAWWIYFGASKTNISLFAKDNSLVLENVSRLKSFRDTMPKWMIKKDISDIDNKEGLKYAELDNSYLTFIAQKDKRAASGLARGQTIAVQHWDEFAYFVNNVLSYAAATSATDTGSDQARQRGLPACNIITTTAGDLSDEAGEFAYSILSQAMRFNERLYDCQNRIELVRRLYNGSINSMIYVQFSYLQLGKDESWFKRVTRSKTAVEIAKDYLCRWQYGSANPVVPKHLLNVLHEGKREPFTVEFINDLEVRWFVDPELIKSDQFKHKPFIIGSDTSDNVGNDFTSIVIINPDDMSLLASCRCNLINPVSIIKFLELILIEWFDHSVLVMERNKNGAIIIDLLISTMIAQNINPYKRIFNSLIQNNPEQPTKIENLSSGAYRKAFGYQTTASSRDVLYKQVLIRMIELCGNRIPDEYLIDEISGLVLKNGRIDHANGKHDDELISFMLAGFFILLGQNHQLYGILPGELMCQIDSKGNTVDSTVKRQIFNIKARLKDLQQLIDNATSEIVKLSLQREYKALADTLPEDDKELITVEQLNERNATINKKVDVAAFVGTMTRINNLLTGKPDVSSSSYRRLY